MRQAKRVAIYARVSTGDQTTDNQLRELRAVAERAGWHVVEEFVDHAINGAKGRDQRYRSRETSSRQVMPSRIESRIGTLEAETGADGSPCDLVQIYEQFTCDTGAVPLDKLPR